MTSMQRLKKISKTPIFIGVGAFLLGVLLILAIRFATFSGEKETHYHANFAVYINGQREEFKGSNYYEETIMCVEHSTVTPALRAHMHDHVNNVIHIHDHAVTWGQFFENLGWYVGDDFIKTKDNLYVSDEQNKLSIILNGQDLTGLTSVTNRVIGDEDKLLLDFGSTSGQALQQEYKAIPSTAHKYDITPDPKSCSGNQKPSFSDRLKHLF